MKNESNNLQITVPTFKELMPHIIEVLISIGGSATVSELNEKVIASLNLPEETSGKIYEIDKSGKSIIQTNLSWARSYLKKSGLIINSERGIWSLTPQYKNGQAIDVDEIVRAARNLHDNKSAYQKGVSETEDSSLNEQTFPNWKEQLRQTLLQLEPDAFERLARRLLLELGFVQVEVTGRSGDGGIDGKGIAKLQGILSFHVVFQCKRYKDVVRSPAIRDFRGAAQGKAEKGLFITTGTFSNEAVKEATRDGALAIDLVDGDALALMLKQLGLGIQVRMVEQVIVDTEWFMKI